MRTTFVLLSLSLAATAPSAALAQQSPTQPGFTGLFTPWTGTVRESLRAETEARRPATGAVPAYAEHQRSQADAVALGERVAEVVRLGDCEEGERIARQAGDFALARAVRSHCGLAAATAR